MPAWRLLLVVGVIATTTAARADDGREAERWFRDGNAAMDRHQPAAAAAAYRAAWQLERRAKVALDLGVALAEAGDIAGAAQAFEVYLDDPASDPAKRPVLAQQLTQWRPQLGRIAIHTTPADATVTVDGVRPLRADGVVNIPALPGSHRVAIQRAGFARTELAVVVVAQQTAESNANLVALAPPHVDDPYRAPMWIALGTAGVAGAVGAVAGVVAAKRWNTAREHCPGGVCATPSDYALGDRARHAGYVADAAFAACGVALVGAAILWRLEPRHSTVAIAPTPRGAVLGWQLAF